MNNATRKGYRVVDMGQEGYMTLFHGINKSRKLKQGRWLTCERKIVCEGVGGRKYISAFHVLPTLADCFEFAKIFKNRENRRIISLKYRQFRPKRNARGPVLLANQILIPKRCEVYSLP